VLTDDREMFVDRSMREILPWCMAQHFSVRLYAQVVIFPQCINIYSMSKACKQQAFIFVMNEHQDL